MITFIHGIETNSHSYVSTSLSHLGGLEMLVFCCYKF